MVYCEECQNRADVIGRLEERFGELRGELKATKELLTRWLAWGAADSGVIDNDLFTDTDVLLTAARGVE